MEKIQIGLAVNAAGLKGEIKVLNYSDYKERFAELDGVYLDNDFYKIAGVRYMKETVILKLEGIDDRNAAEGCKGRGVFIGKADLRKLPEDRYYIFDLIGLTAVTEGGEALGTVTDVIQNRAQDLYEIERENKDKFLIPAVEEFILNIDIAQDLMTVRLIEGLGDL